MADIFRTLIVPFSKVDLARSVAASFGPGGEGMWITTLSPDGMMPQTHYISSGYIPEQFAYLVPLQSYGLNEDGEVILVSSELGDPVAVYEAASAAGVSCTQAQINALFAAADVTDQEPFVAMQRLGLKIISPTQGI